MDVVAGRVVVDVILELPFAHVTVSVGRELLRVRGVTAPLVLVIDPDIIADLHAGKEREGSVWRVWQDNC